MKQLLSLLLLVPSVCSFAQNKERVEAFPLESVTLADGTRWRSNQQQDSAWIASFPVKRLLHSFRTTAGVYSAFEGGYAGKQKIERLGGWESLDCDLRGHAIGHLLSAYALMANALPSEKGRKEMLAKGDSLVAGIRECQEMIGNGYVAAFPEGLINRNMQGKSVWAPWYTIHKLLAGLILQYKLCGNATALTVCKDFATWAERKLHNVDEKQRALMLRNEFGGIGEAFYDLYTITGDARHLWLSDFFNHNEKLDPLYDGNFDMGTMHCNTFLPKTICEVKKSVRGMKMGKAFWHSLISNHILAPGCLSDKEHFFNPKETSKHLTGNTGETCCTYNLLKLTRELYAGDVADADYFDYYERALYNHILGQQDPETGMVHYFLPTQTGAYKLYSTYDRSFWCCVGSSFESHAKYAESIYWHSKDNDTVYVNLFIPSELNAEGLKIKLRTDFPATGKVMFDVKSDRNIVIMLRLPSWAGKAGYKAYSIKKGQRTITHVFPMTIHTEATPDDPNRIAVFYGPILLAGQLGTEGVDCWSNPDKHNDYYGYDYKVPEHLKSVSIDANSLKRTGALEWQTADGIKVKPLYDTHRERYVVYWQKK